MRDFILVTEPKKVQAIRFTYTIYVFGNKDPMAK